MAKEIFKINVPDAIIKKAKEAYLQNMKDMAKPTGDKKQDEYYKQVMARESEFWNKVEKLPWDEQKQLIFARFSADLKTPGIVAIKNKLMPAEREAIKSMGVMRGVSESIQSAWAPSEASAERLRAQGHGDIVDDALKFDKKRKDIKSKRMKAMEEIANEGFSIDTPKTNK